MPRSGWTVVGLALAFVIIQACGDELGTGRIMTPGAAPPGAEQSERSARSEGPPLTPRQPPMLLAYEEANGRWPDFQYDDGSEYWDGSEPVELSEWSWSAGAAQYRGELGRRYLVRCEPGRAGLAVWGANPYTDDSPVCAAGVHLGIIDRENGGEVVFEIRPAQRSFDGVTRNGVTGLSWGPYPGSYRVITE